MRLTRIEPGAYHCLIGGWEMTIRRDWPGRAWHHQAREVSSGERFIREGSRTKAEAVAMAMGFWLRRRLNWLLGQCGDTNGLVTACLASPKDSVSPRVLRDFLVETGREKLLSVILAEGDKARVKWPPGWDEVNESMKEDARCSPRGR